MSFLNAMPDMESRIVVRSSAGDTLTSKDHSSPRGMNGYYVYRAKWSPDSQFFVYSLVSSGGHSPWSFPIMVFGRKNSVIAKFSNMIDGKPTLSGEFTFSGPHTLTATTWRQPAVGDKALNDKVPITVDLEEAFKKLPSSELNDCHGLLGCAGDQSSTCISRSVTNRLRSIAAKRGMARSAKGDILLGKSVEAASLG